MSRTAIGTAVAFLLLTTPAAMTASDPTTGPGTELARVVLPEDLPTGIMLRDIAVSDAGWVAVGYQTLGTPGPLALYSKDGSSWSVASITGEPEASLLSRVTAVGSGFVAGGMPGALWISPDGRTWEARPLDPPLDHAFLFDLTSHDRTLYGVGCGWAGGEQQCEDVGAWRSDDLRTLQPMPPLEPTFLPAGIAADGSGVVTVGWLGTRTDTDYVVEGWSARTGDGQTWTTQSLGAGSTLLSVAREMDGWIAVGRQDEQMLVVRSDDGLDWTDALASPSQGSAILAVSGPITVLAGCRGDTPVCPSEVFRLESDGTLTSLPLGGIEPGEVAYPDGLALSPDGELLVVGSVMHGIDGPETSALWWSDMVGPDTAGR